MKLVKFDIEKDYNQISDWWTKQNWPSIPKEYLSEYAFMAQDNGVNIAITFVFTTNCPMNIMEWTVGNPEVNWELRNKGIELIIEEACKWSKKNGAKQVLTMTGHKRFINKLEKSGFNITDKDVTHLMRGI